MRSIRTIRSLTIAAGLAATLGFAASAARADECPTPEGLGRTLEGELKQVGGKELIVTSKGEHIKFAKFGSITVKGLKTTYDDLKKGDYVVVCSKLLAKPRMAYDITVKEKPKDEAVDM
jgi:hypothetical protein